MPSNWLVFDRIRALTKQHSIYQAERILQNQSSLDRLIFGNEFLDVNAQAAILDQTNLQINRLERYKDYEQMDQTGEISLALDLYADEGCLTGDTRIPLLDGSYPTIAELESNGIDHEFWVYSYDIHKAKYVPAKAKSARITGRDIGIVSVKLDDGLIIRCTSNHLFLLNNGEFVRAIDLVPGDNLRRLTAEEQKSSKVVSVESCGVADKVYDIEVPQYHCFAAGTIDSWVIVHNSLVDPERKHTITIRARNRRLKKELENLFFDTLLWDTHCRPSIRYLCKYGDLPFEVILNVERDGVSSLRFMNVYNFTRIETRYGDLVGFFFQNMLYPQPQFMHPWQVMHLRLTSFENIYHPYGRCCDPRSKIMVPGGYKELGDIKSGDIVYSFDGLRPIKTVVRNTVLDTIKPSLALSTKYRSFTVSEDHPVLAVLPGANGKLFRRYVPAKHVVPGSMIVTHDPEYDESNSYMVEEVIGQKEVGLRLLGDIQVESGYSNFISNGVAVHNSILDGGRKAFKQLRLMEDAALIYRICLRGDQLIWTVNGHKPIKNIKIGDMVYCFKDGKLKLTKVINWMCNGKDVIYRVSSQHREIYCNATHPILVERSYANKQKNDKPARLEYVDVKDLLVKKNGVASHHRFLLPQIEHTQYVKLRLPKVPTYARLKAAVYVSTIYGRHNQRRKIVERFYNGDKWLPQHTAELLCAAADIETDLEYRQGWVYDAAHNICHEFDLPEYIDEQFARLFGFMIGDGYISKRRSTTHNYTVSEVGLALGNDTVKNKQYIDLFNTFFGKSLHTPDERSNGDGKQYICSTHCYELFVLNGFISGAKNKRIPDWVYLSPRSVQEAFVDGYIDADIGTLKFKNRNAKTESCEIECCNEALTRDFKELFNRLGWESGLVRRRDRVNGHEIEPGRVIPETVSWCLYFTKKQKHQMDYVVHTGDRHSAASESILAVEEVGEDLVYDITVEDEVHNIIVHGVPTHQTRAPEKRKFIIPVGLIPPKEVPEYMAMIARNYKRQRFYNPSTGTFDERYSPLIQEDDFLLPRRSDGSGPDIETFPGAENLDQIADIEYFKKKMIAPTKIPFARVGIGEGAGEASEKSLSQSHSEFAKSVQWVQREVATGLKKVAIIHLALRGYSVEDLRGFDIALTATSAMEELYRIETWQTRVGVMADLKDLGWFPKEWIVTHFTDLSPDEIEELKDIEQTESQGGPGGGSPGGLDLGGGDSGLDMGGEGEGESPEGEPEEPEEGLSLEGLDYQAQRRLLFEMNKQGRTKDARIILEKWANRLGKPTIKDEQEIMSGYDYFLKSKELDGLSRTNVIISESTDPSAIHDPNNDEGLLVEWSIEPEVRNEVINEIRNILTGTSITRDDDASDITDNDLPIHVSEL